MALKLNQNNVKKLLIDFVNSDEKKNWHSGFLALIGKHVLISVIK